MSLMVLKGLPYVEGDAPNPINVYGQSKWEGEEAVRARLEEHLIVRSAWIFGADRPNFVKTIFSLARERERLQVVADQYGCPTPVHALAQRLLDLAPRVRNRTVPWGTVHLAGQPPTSWYELAEAVVEEGRRMESLAVQSVEPVATSAYPTPARRPQNTALDASHAWAVYDIEAPLWRPAVTQVVSQLSRL